ncbi:MULTISPECIES: hypothetical protein [unclassified Nocardioides]|uniref:hypothetical protein n=1 Tax=unclassified Nocardioides TaxID=2615069 RepID=UPI0009F0653E|nr:MULTISPECIES: hypothetical protein [unclassified Nocardioides]GAW52573.1 uncharacterized protein (Precursor) [Nocardioides sp. PD653-B2]GAW55588.1 uncharacterized protein (Precursor) [Nocardioides sp. PD653]
MFIAVCCDRGAPGSTTTALALGVSTPEPTVVVGVDPYGDDLAQRCIAPGGGSFPPTPTVLTLASEARKILDASLVASMAHEFTASTRVLPGHYSAELAGGINDWKPLAAALRMSGSRVVADLGRIHSSSPTVPVAAAADVIVMVTRPEVGAVLHLKDRLERLAPVVAKIRNAPPMIVPVVVTPKRIAGGVVDQVGQLLAPSNAAGVIKGIGWVAIDPDGYELMYAGKVGGKDARTPLLRSAAVLNDQLDGVSGVRSYAEPEDEGEIA